MWRISQLFLPLLTPLYFFSARSLAAYLTFPSPVHLPSVALFCYWLAETWSVGKSVCPAGYQWHHSSEKQCSPLLFLIDGLGSALRVAAQPDLRRHANTSLCTLKAPGSNPVSLPFPCKQCLFTRSQGGNECGSDWQTILWCSLHVRTGFLSLSLSPRQSSFLQNISVCCQAFFSLAMGPVDTRIRHFSHGGEWDKLAAITIHEAAWSTLSPVVSTRCLSAPPLPLLFISQGWLMRSTRLIPPLEQQWL